MSSGREKFHRNRGFIRTARAALSWLPSPLVQTVLLPLTPLRGSLGALGRYLLAARQFAKLGEACYFAPLCVIKSPDKVEVGDRFSLHEFCYLDAAGSIRIGNDVAIAHSCSVLTANHRWSDSCIPIKYNAVEMAAVEIGDDVWIGCGVKILPGTTIESRVVVAAGAVVRGRLESGFLYAGVPARKIKPL